MAQLLNARKGLGQLKGRKVKPVKVFLKFQLKHAQLIARFHHPHLDHVPAQTPGGLKPPVPGDKLIGAIHRNRIHQAAGIKAVHEGLQITQLHAHPFFYGNLV
jgi:hypothetical protein